jgi:NAD(P)-dependent dehydrogenase (short-subunit alcohol dehydrogenase family)
VRVDVKSLKQLMDLSGRKALLTGGGGYIGLAAAEALIELGAKVAIIDKDVDICDRRVAELNLYRADSALSFPCNLLDESATRAVVQNAVKQMDGLDILIHCAAYVGTTEVPGWAVPFEQQTVAAWDAAMRVNLTAAFVLAQEAKDSLTASGHGVIIFVSSIYGLLGPEMRLYEGTNMANAAGYGASKSGLLQLSRYLATVLAPLVRVNAITPGGVWRNQPDVFHGRYKMHTPLNRMAVEEDLKGAFAYLASDLSKYVTGHNLLVDGGWTIW